MGTVDLDARVRTIARFDDRPSGLGFLPDGSPIVALMDGRQVMRVDGKGRSTAYADLRSIPAENLNDMIVDAAGRAYVDCIKNRPANSTADVGDCIVMLKPNGEFQVVAQGGLHRPNGLVLTRDGRTLIAAELPMHRLTAFDVGDDGSLTHGSTYAEVPDDLPDGICMDEEGAVWLASPWTRRFLRVLRGGQVTDSITLGERQWATACVLGGDDRRTLFMTTARVPADPRPGMNGNLYESIGAILTTTVAVAGSGLP